MTLNVVFMGTSEFSVPALDILIKKKFNILKVYTQPPKKSKRGQKINPSSIENFCKKNKINFKNPINLNNEEELKNFKKLSADIVVVGDLLPQVEGELQPSHPIGLGGSISKLEHAYKRALNRPTYFAGNTVTWYD